MEGRYHERQDSEVSQILCRLSMTDPKTRRFSIKHGSCGTASPRARCRSTYPFPLVHSVSCRLLLLLSSVPDVRSAAPLGTFWNSKGVWDVRYEEVYLKKKWIIILFGPSAFYSGALRYTLPFFVVCSISTCSSLISALYFKNKFWLFNSFASFKTSCSVFCHLETVGIPLKSLKSILLQQSQAFQLLGLCQLRSTFFLVCTVLPHTYTPPHTHVLSSKCCVFKPFSGRYILRSYKTMNAKSLTQGRLRFFFFYNCWRAAERIFKPGSKAGYRINSVVYYVIVQIMRTLCITVVFYRTLTSSSGGIFKH